MRQPAYFGGLAERLGFLPRFDRPGAGSQAAPQLVTGSATLWLHAVSVGEVLSSVELIRRLKDRRPGLRVFVSTATLAGRDAAEARLADLASGVFFAPLDYRSVVRRVLRRLRPVAVVILETEIWPNLYREAKRAGASLLVVNGRISDRALPKYRRWSWLFRHVLRWPDRILAQSEQDRERYAMAGAPPERVACIGNLKYDFRPPGDVAPEIAALLDRTPADEVWVAASTMPAAEPGDPDEDDVVIETFQQLAARRPRLLLILAPRRPERFDAAAGRFERAGVSFVRRSRLADGVALELPGALLLDTIGELAAVFRQASVVFMGGTLASRGGHNLLEPAYFGKPVIVGPHMENFAEIAREFGDAHAIRRIHEPGDLAKAVDEVLDDRREAHEIGERARQLAEARRGAVDRVADQVLEAIAEGVPDPPRTLAARMILRPLACAWAAGHRINMARGLAAARKLSTTVISVGGLTMGGAGKSPVVAHLAGRLAEAGCEPAILTRGYRRRAGNAAVIVPRGATAPVAQTGDEAQMFIRRHVAHVGIAADRYQAGRRIEQELKPAVFLLDDGFQHFRLKRDQDIVLIDAQDPVAGGLFPVGRRREPFAGLARATAIIITRWEPGTSTTGIEALVRRYNPGAPIFRASTVAREWLSADGDSPDPAFAQRSDPVAAFCGLAVPRSFWRTLEQSGLDIVYRRAFDDHHSYSEKELARLASEARAAGARVLVTTEKDRMNLPARSAAAGDASLPVYYLRIGVEIENEDELLRRLIP